MYKIIQRTRFPIILYIGTYIILNSGKFLVKHRKSKVRS